MKAIDEEKGFGNLRRQELLKYNRKETFLRKIKDNEPFTLVSGEEVYVPVDKNASAIEQLSGKDFPSLVYFCVSKDKEGTKDLRWIPLGKFRKTAEDFGGGNGGAAGGTIQTNTVEAGQCIVNALIQNGVDPDNFSKVIENTEAIDHCCLKDSVSIRTVWSAVKDLSPEWQSSLVKIGHHLTSTFGQGYWHWKDSFMNSIGEKYRSYPEDQRLLGAVDRWNPADIWYTTEACQDINNIPTVKAAKTCQEFTAAMNELYKERKIVGISLKKLDGEEVQSSEKNAGSDSDKIVLDSIEVSDEIRNGSSTLNVTARESNGQEWILAFGQDNTYPKLRVRLKNKSKSNHMDGSCIQSIIDFCLEKAFKFSEKQLQMYRPEHYVPEVEQRRAEDIANHPGDYSEEDLKEAEIVLENKIPLQDSISIIVDWQSAREMSVAKIACIYALEALKELLTGDKEGTMRFITSILSYCLSVWQSDGNRTNSAAYYKVH